MNFAYTQHALTVIRERGLSQAWVERVAAQPELREPDPHDPEVERRYGRVPEAGNRVLRVSVNRVAQPERVVSAHFDRRMKGRL